MKIKQKVSVASRARRSLRNICRFKFSADSECQDLRLELRDQGYGEIIGVYENPPDYEPKHVIITEIAIGCLGDAPIRWILFDDIETTEGPKQKLTDDSISVVLKSGLRTQLRIAGGDERFKDIFSFVRFIDRVLEDRRNENKNSGLSTAS